MISQGLFFNIFIVQTVRGLKGQKMAQKKSIAVDISGTMYHMIVIYGRLV